MYNLVNILAEVNIDSWANRIARQYGIILHLYYDGDDIILNSIIIPKERQGEGLGTKVMEELIGIADSEGRRIRLTPGLYDKRHGTTSQGRLIKFYKRFGFILNKGRNKDFRFSELMYREPQ